MPKPTRSSKSLQDDQLSRFIETARPLGCGEDKERFEAKLGEIVAHKLTKDGSNSESKREGAGSKLTAPRKPAHISKKNTVP